ncbi:hypothetical protein HHX47_DHR7000780, partial [Lentinula edodes]
KDIFFVASLDVLVVDWFSTLTVDPTNIQRAILQTPVEVLDVSHHPGHLDSTLNCELSPSFHFPTGTSATPRSHFGGTSDNHDLVQVKHTPKLGDINKRVLGFEGGEVESEVSTREDVHSLNQTLCINTIENLEVSSIVTSDSTAHVTLFRKRGPNTSRDIGEVWKTIHATIEISPNGFHLSDTEQQRVHQTKDVERHFLGRECADTEAFKLVRYYIRGSHESGTTGPSVQKNSGKTEIFTPAFGSPTLEECFQRDLRFRVQAVVAEQTMIRRQGEDNLSRTRNKVSTGFFVLHCAKNSQQVGQHDAVSQLGLVVNSIDLSAVLGNTSERKYEIQVHAEGRVDVIHKSLDVLLRTLVEGHHIERL